MNEQTVTELTFLGVDHPAVAADDVETLADWYCTVLGYIRWFHHRTVGGAALRPQKPVWMLRAPDNTLLEIMPKDETARLVRTTWTPGWSHVAMRVADIDKAINWLNKHGIVWGGDLTNAIGGGRVRNFFDPDGNMLQLLERGDMSEREPQQTLKEQTSGISRLF